MTVNELVRRYYEKHPNGHFFDRDTLKFFGERLSEMYVWKGKVKKTDSMGVTHTCYVLSSLQRKHPMGPRRVYHYFDAETFDDVAA